MTMRHMGLGVLLAVSLLFLSPKAEAGLNRGDWIGSGGIGLMVSPTMFLINPQIEYVYRRNVFLGPMLQTGLGSGGALVGASFSARLMFGQHPRLRPNVEGGLGIAAASSGFKSSVGALIHIGLGFDFLIEDRLSVGTIMRANFAPPLQSFIFSWPIFMVRYIL
jgi:hypothetical protein